MLCTLQLLFITGGGFPVVETEKIWISLFHTSISTFGDGMLLTGTLVEFVLLTGTSIELLTGTWTSINWTCTFNVWTFLRDDCV